MNPTSIFSFPAVIWLIVFAEKHIFSFMYLYPADLDYYFRSIDEQ